MSCCNNLYIISFLACSEAGLALVSAASDSSAISILRNSGKYNGNSEAYQIIQIRNIGLGSSIQSELLMESYVNALVAYEAIVKSLDRISATRIANDLVTDDDSAALAAPQGGVLDSRLASVENALAEISGNYLPMSGGEMDNDASVSIYNSDRDKYITIAPDDIEIVDDSGVNGIRIATVDPISGFVIREGSALLGHRTVYGIGEIINYSSRIQTNLTLPTNSGTLALLSDIPIPVTLEEVTYSELLSLSEGSDLVPGRYYRITDYLTTTSDPESRTSNHQFDIVVLAIGVSTLSEEAHAMQHRGDTYFANSNLSAWKIWYALDNDTSRFAWADATNGKGVIYRMIDEWNNDCPYDFKNIRFKRKLANGEYYPESGVDTWVYTFTWVDENYDVLDLSIVGPTLSNDESMYPGIFGNTIKECSEFAIYPDEQGSQFRLMLSNNVLIFSYYFDYGYFYGCYSNTFGNNCYSNTLGNSCYSNTFGNGCYSNTFRNNCYYNAFGDSCYSNTLGHECYSNSFGAECHSNTFGNSCSFNTIGNNCHYIEFGESCDSNIIGNECQSITLGEELDHITFGNYCRYIKFGNSSQIINYVRRIDIGSGCQYLYVNSSDVSASGTNYLQNVSIAQGITGTNSSRVTITIPDRNLRYETKVGYNSAGVLKIYCEADLVS